MLTYNNKYVNIQNFDFLLELALQYSYRVARFTFNKRLLAEIEQIIIRRKLTEVYRNYSQIIIDMIRHNFVLS